MPKPALFPVAVLALLRIGVGDDPEPGDPLAGDVLDPDAQADRLEVQGTLDALHAQVFGRLAMQIATGQVPFYPMSV